MKKLDVSNKELRLSWLISSDFVKKCVFLRFLGTMLNVESDAFTRFGWDSTVVQVLLEVQDIHRPGCDCAETAVQAGDPAST
jgi:hypothetical protein